jgi:hypothetical protein
MWVDAGGDGVSSSTAIDVVFDVAVRSGALRPDP